MQKFEAYVNDVNTKIVFNGTFITSVKMYRVTAKHYLRQYSKVLKYCTDNKILGIDDIQHGKYNFYFVKNGQKYKFSHHVSGMSKNLDNGYFVTMAA